MSIPLSIPIPSGTLSDVDDRPEATRGLRADLDDMRREADAVRAEIHLELNAATRETQAALREAMAEIRQALREVWTGSHASDAAAAGGPGQRMTRAERKELTRELLFDAAIEVFARKGYHGASLDDVAEAAGFTKGAVYSNFTRKSDLFRALLERESRRRSEGLAAVIADVPLALLPEVCAEWLRRPDDEQLDRDILDLESRLAAVRDPALRPALLQAREALAGVLDEKLAGAPQFTLDGHDLARLIEALSVGLLADQYLDPGGGQATLMGRVVGAVIQAALAAGEPAGGRSGTGDAATSEPQGPAG
jgi:AcrR family transcriptional regulator